MKEIIEALNKVFEPMDARVLAETQIWASERKAALKTFLLSDEYAQLRKNVWNLYAKLYFIAGGKKWYQIFSGNSDKIVQEFVIKNHKTTVDSRNYRIAAKLEKAGILSVIDSKFQYTSDGFNGSFRINTDAGEKLVTVDTIYAGGYNIQCAHLRVLVKVR